MFNIFKKNQEILVINKADLFSNKNKLFNGFKHRKDDSYEDLIIDNGLYIIKNDSKGKVHSLNSEYKKITPFFIIEHKGKYLINISQKDNNIDKNQYSLGFKTEIKPLKMSQINKLVKYSDLSVIDFGVINSFSSQFKHIEKPINFDILGYINCEDCPITNQHFGIVYKINLKNEITPKNKKFENNFLEKKEIIKNCKNYDLWSNYILNRII
jgi:predicted NUDIX family phosphoesterase